MKKNDKVLMDGSNICWTISNTGDNGLIEIISGDITAVTHKSNLKKAVRDYNVGNSDYSKHDIQPWDIWEEYNLDPWDADIIKRILRNKDNQRLLDYQKIIHICEEKIRQLTK